MVIGLDSAPPGLLFERFLPCMPTVQRLLREGAFGPLRSVVPPITVPAWACMTSGQDPGALGLYGFRNRATQDGRPTYAMKLSTARDIQAPFIWETLAQKGKKAVALFVPPLFPPRALSDQITGSLETVGCLLTPDARSSYAASYIGDRMDTVSLSEELNARFGDYIPDVIRHPHEPDETLYARLCTMTKQHFSIARHMWLTRNPDFLMMVEIGLDRFHHQFFDQLDTYGHRYYGLIDQCIQSLIEVMDENTAIMLVSDHGVKPLVGGFCVNQFLMDRKWLNLKDNVPERPFALKPEYIDWSRTRAWGEGGYYGRVFLNLRGRDPDGIVPPSEVATSLSKLKADFEDGPIPVQCFSADDLIALKHYKRALGHPPDLQVFFDNLNYRAIGSIGATPHLVDRAHPEASKHPALYRLDGANHDWDGIVVFSKKLYGQQRLPTSILHVHAFISEFMT